MSDDEWQIYLSKKTKSGLKLSCCDMVAVCKEKNGIRYFDHGYRCACKGRELIQVGRQKYKISIVNALIASGWDVQTETEVPDVHVVDVYATKNNSKLIVETCLKPTRTVASHISTKNEDVKKITAKLLKKQNIKILWLIEVDNNNVGKVLAQYNEHSNVFGLRQDKDGLYVLGLSQKIIQDSGDYFENIGEVEFDAFLDAFFIKKTISKLEFEPTKTAFNYEFNRLRCTKCGQKSGYITHINTFYCFKNHELKNPIPIERLWYLDAKDKKIHKIINDDALSNNLPVKLLFKSHYTEDEIDNDETLQVEQCCTHCKTRFYLCDDAMELKAEEHSKILFVDKLKNTNLSNRRTGVVWISQGN